RIRSCGLQHAGELALLHASLFDDAWGAATFKELLADPGTLAFAAGPGGTGAEEAPALWGLVVGRVAVGEAELLALAVARDHQRLGIGGRLIEKLCRVAGKRGARRLYLEVAESNGAARALYGGLGFAEIGRRRGYYVHPGAPLEDAINMCLTLPATLSPGAT